MIVENHDNLVKVGGSVVDRDATAFSSYISRRNFLRARQAQTDAQDVEINSLKSELAELKMLLKKVLND